LFVFFNRKLWKNRNLLILLAICIGVFSLGAIQAISNKYTMDVLSIAVPTGGLNLAQLRWGMEMNLYETYVGASGAPAGFAFDNVSGIRILRQEGIDFFASYGEYFVLLLRYPVEMLGIYVRHFIAIMNPITGGSYVYSRNNNSRFVFTLFNYTLLFITASFIKRRFIDCSFTEIKKQIKGTSNSQRVGLISLLTLLLPFAAIIPGAVEERFAIPFWLVLYGLICYVVSIRHEISQYKKRPISYAILYFMGFAFMIALLTEIYAHNSGDVFIPILYFR